MARIATLAMVMAESSKFETVAAAFCRLGITVPPTLLARADEVIERIGRAPQQNLVHPFLPNAKPPAG